MALWTSKRVQRKLAASTAFAVCALVFSAGAAEPPKAQVPISNTEDTSGSAVYVDDAVLRSAIPSLAGAGSRVKTCANSMMDPPRLFLAYGPVVDSVHSGRLTHVQCEFKDPESMRTRDGVLDCQAPHVESVGFIEDPSHYFSVYGVDASLARSIAADFFAGRIDYDAGVTRVEPGIREISIDNFEGRLAVRWGDCGCSNVLRVQPRKGAPLHATRSESICI